MVYVVERYLPGLLRSDLLRGLARLERWRRRGGARREVRYLGSTIVLGDDACFCQFEGPSAAAVAEANRQSRSPVRPDRPRSHRQTERRTTMSMSTVHPRNRPDQADEPPRSRSQRLPCWQPPSTGLVPRSFAVEDGASAPERRRRPASRRPVQRHQAASVGRPSTARRRGEEHRRVPVRTSGPLTPAQRQAVRDYWLGASMPMSPTEAKSIGTFLFGASVPLDRAQLQAVRNYWLGASSPASTPAPDGPTPSAVESIATYLLGHSILADAAPSGR